MSSSSIVMQPHEGYGAGKDPFLTPLQQQAVAGYRRLQIDAERRGWLPASLINLHPFSWPVTGPIHQVDIKIPAVPLDADVWLAAPKLKLASGLEIPYTQHVFAQWKPLQQKYLMGQIDFEEVNDSGHIWPIEQADDAVKQNSLGADRGGVFCFEGTHLPGSVSKTSAMEMERFEEAHRVQIVYYTNWYEKACDAYMGRQTTNSWKDLIGKGKYHRWIAMYLFRLGKIRELPAWYQEVAQVGGQKQRKCGSCGHNLEPTAVICSPKTCGWVVDPYRAFDELLIDEETPGVKLAAKRLTAEEIEKLIDSGKLTEQHFIDWGFSTHADKPASRAKTAAKKKTADDKDKEVKAE
jgi:hypothetical protein